MPCKKNRKGFDLIDETMKIGQVSTGTMMVGAMPGMLSKSLPGTSETASNIQNKTSSSLSLLPTMQGVGSVFGSLSMLEDTVRKRKRR